MFLCNKLSTRVLQLFCLKRKIQKHKSEPGMDYLSQALENGTMELSSGYDTGNRGGLQKNGSGHASGHTAH
jgi:hypothetical protein